MSKSLINLYIKPKVAPLEDLQIEAGEKCKGNFFIGKYSQEKTIREEDQIQDLIQDITALIIGIGWTQSKYFDISFDKDYLSSIASLMEQNEDLSDELSHLDVSHLKEFEVEPPDENDESNIVLKLTKKLLFSYYDSRYLNIEKIQNNIIGFDTPPLNYDNELDQVILDTEHPAYLFWKKWGSLSYSIKDYNQLLLTGLTGFLWLSLYSLIKPKEGTVPLVGIFNEFYTDKVKSKGHESNYWVINFNNQGEIDWIPVDDYSNIKEIPRLIFSHPPDEFSSREEEATWIIKEIGRNISVYISEQKMEFKCQVIEKSLLLEPEGEINDLFLFCIMKLLSVERNTCECGCGFLARPNSKYASNKCRYNKYVYNKKKQIRNWLKRDKILEENGMEVLSNKIESWIDEGKTEEEINEILRNIRTDLKQGEMLEDILS